MIAFGGTALGSLIIGTSADWFGLQHTVVVSGILCVVIALLAPTGDAADRRLEQTQDN